MNDKASNQSEKLDVSQKQDEQKALAPEKFRELMTKNFRLDAESEKELADETEHAFQQLAKRALKHKKLISANAIGTIEALISRIDEELAKQIDLVIHHPEFQELEGSWRGLHYLVNNTETDQMLQIQVMNVSKHELYQSLVETFKGTAWDTSPFFKQVYGEFDTLGGHPYGCIVGDYYFDNNETDVALLGEIAKTAAAAHAPFIAGASPSVLNMESWQDLNNPRALGDQFINNPKYASWNALREAEESRYIGLAMPRFLARIPYGPEKSPVDEFYFEEKTDRGDHSKYCWANSAYAMAVNINRAFKLYGWCANIRGPQAGGTVKGLPVDTFPTDDGSVDMKCPTEIAIGSRREHELAKLGFMAIQHRKNTEEAVFMGAQSLQKPQEFEDKDATENAQLSARLPYMFACSRFAHFLKHLGLEMVGLSLERHEVEKELGDWVKQYVLKNPGVATQVDKAKKPLAAAEVVVKDVEGNPGYYDATFYLRPHYQLEGLSVSLRLVSKLPSQRS
jgi:type VI secretion system protein ImpC